jgi:hypothetical protein
VATFSDRRSKRGQQQQLRKAGEIQRAFQEQRHHQHQHGGGDGQRQAEIQQHRRQRQDQQRQQAEDAERQADIGAGRVAAEVAAAVVIRNGLF